MSLMQVFLKRNFGTITPDALSKTLYRVTMTNNSNSSRRNFLKHSSLGLGVSLINMPAVTSMAPVDHDHSKLPFEITVATIDVKDGYNDETPEQRLQRVIRSMKNVSGLKPDIVCVPEGFSYYKLAKSVSLSSVAQERSVGGPLTSKLAAFARENKCYVTCPVISQSGQNFFSSTIIIDRKGNLAGIYDKMFPSKKEMLPDADGNRILPGAINQSLIKTDFGTLGLQMGNDVYDEESWKNISAKGAKIIVYSSGFPGGRMLNYHAVSNHCYVISSTISEGRIIDISGTEIDRTSEFIRYSWSRLNTDRTNILTFPNRLPELFKKYGNRLQLKVWGSTDMLTIESRDASLKVKDVLKEFELQTYAELIATETQVQNQYRDNL
jgi:beta-ureidopropionase